MKYALFTVLGLLLLGHLSWADQTAFDLRGASTGEEAWNFERLPSDVRVRADGFSALVPMNWSLAYADNSYFAYGEGKKFDFISTITFTPTADIVHDHTYISVINRTFPKGKTLDEIYEKRKLNPKYDLSFETWNDKRWLVARYINDDDEDNITRQSWIAWYVNDTLDFEVVVLSQTPLDPYNMYYHDLIEALLPQVWAEPGLNGE